MCFVEKCFNKYYLVLLWLLVYWEVCRLWAASKPIVEVLVKEQLGWSELGSHSDEVVGVIHRVVHVVTQTNTAAFVNHNIGVRNHDPTKVVHGHATTEGHQNTQRYRRLIFPGVAERWNLVHLVEPSKRATA